jgi:DNA-binding MarR family transcriptional regulator
MQQLLNRFVEYVSEVTGQRITWGPHVSSSLPQYLAQHYDLYEIGIGNRRLLGVGLKEETHFRPSAFIKHLGKIKAVASDLGTYCLIARDLPSYVRQRMIERQIPFVVPGRQMYWPEFGLVIRARKATGTPNPVSTISPATQVVLILMLTGGMTAPSTPKALAAKLGYTAMTMSRALDEIEANGLGGVFRKGRERFLDFADKGQELWQLALRYLRSPVRETVRIKEKDLLVGKRILGGEMALASLSMLVPPKEPVYALGRQAWRRLAGKLSLIPVEDEGTCRVQLWRYDPALFARDGRVDCFSLYLSLQDEQDERVQAALKFMMEQTSWS